MARAAALRAKINAMSVKKPRNKCLNCGLECIRPEYIYCSNKCQGDHTYEKYIRDWITGTVEGTTVSGVSLHIKRYLRSITNNKCQLCGWDKVNPVTGVCPLEVDHINGDHSNSRPENIRLICPNCHALTPTFRGLNKGSGRKYRRKAP